MNTIKVKREDFLEAAALVAEDRLHHLANKYEQQYNHRFKVYQDERSILFEDAGINAGADSMDNSWEIQWYPQH